MEALGGIGLFVVVLAFLFAVSPLGIWNRLIKIHWDNEKRAKELLAAIETTNKLLGFIANETTKRA